jgi:hypothetical protein
MDRVIRGYFGRKRRACMASECGERCGNETPGALTQCDRGVFCGGKNRPSAANARSPEIFNAGGLAVRS